MITKQLTIIFVLLTFIFSCTTKDNPVAPVTEVTQKIIGKVISAKTGQAIPQVLISTTNSSSSVTTGIDGNYVIEKISPGTYTILASKSGFYTEEISVKIDTGKTVIGDFILSEEKFGVLKGKVIDVVSNAGIFGVTITTDPVSSVVGTDINGNFIIENILILRDQTYTLKAEKNSTYDAVTKTIKFGDSTTINVNLAMDPLYGTIEGTVTDSKTSLPVSGVNITTTPPTSSVLTDALGYYKIDQVLRLSGASKYNIVAVKSGYKKNTDVNVIVLGGRTTRGDVVIDPL
ncbi:MAG: carboxypeptidase regulatory-like domain-containing protein [bacterium]